MSIKRYQLTGKFQTYMQPEPKKTEIIKEHKRGKWCCYSDHKKIISELELSLDDRDCYIAEADMKNEELINHVKVLKEALCRISRINATGYEYVKWANEALKESE